MVGSTVRIFYSHSPYLLAAGHPPWIVRTKRLSKEEESSLGTTPRTSSRTFEEWLEDYVRSKRVVKEFKFFKEIYGWNLDYLSTTLKQVALSAGRSSSVTVSFKSSPDCVHVFSPNAISKISSSYLYIFLTSIILVFPFYGCGDAGGLGQVGNGRSAERHSD